MVKAAQIVNLLEEFASPDLAETWDNSGLQVGSLNAEVQGVLLALDPDPAAVAEAARLGYMLITHHPLLIKGINRIDTARPPGVLIRQALMADVTIYCLHTNLDSTPGGVSDCLAELIGLSGIKVLKPQPTNLFKLVVYVPLSHLDSLRKALGEAGAGHIGQYSHCSFAALGEGSFLPGAGANPYLGNPGQLELVQEFRLETVVKPTYLGRALAAMTKAHPYEEVAYDLFRLENLADHGLGRIGKLPESICLNEFALKVAKTLGCPGVKVTGCPDQPVRKVAVVGGSGADYLRDAWQKGAHCLITGDIKYHQAKQAEELGIALIDPGHYHSEAVILPILAKFLARAVPDLSIKLHSEGADPFRWLSI